MSSSTYNPSIDQAAQLNFRDNFFALAQQKKSQLMNTKAITFLPSSGKTNNMARIGRLELTEVNTRNPDKQYGDYALDNRQFTKRRFTKTIQIDAKYDINELIKDPTSDILVQLNNAKERVIDRIAIAAAVGNVLVGGPDTAPSSISAATDGVLTVDATGGFNYAKVLEIKGNFTANELQNSELMGTVLCVTNTEEIDLLTEDKFINNDYVNARPVVEGYMSRVGMFDVVVFAGSVSGGVQVTNPILPEGVSTRTCVALAPESIAMSMEVALQDVQKSSAKVNSYDITIDLWINAMRTEGVRVQKITATI